MRPSSLLCLVAALVLLVSISYYYLFTYRNIGASANGKQATVLALNSTAQLISNSEKRWRSAHSKCLTQASFELVRHTFSQRLYEAIRNRYFDDNEKMALVLVALNEYYFNSRDAWLFSGGEGTTDAWRQLFEEQRKKNTTITLDLLCSLNVMLHFDMTIVLYHLELTSESWRRDYDRMDDILMASIEDVAPEITRLYEWHIPLFIVRAASKQLIPYWKQNAWHQAEQLKTMQVEKDRDNFIKQCMLTTQVSNGHFLHYLARANSTRVCKPVQK